MNDDTPHNQNMKDQYDVLVIGGGLAGLSLACLLGKQGIRVCCIDNCDPQKTLDETFDGRTTAISWASQKVLKSAGVWDALDADACPIEDIQILDGDSPVLLEFFSDEVDGRAFGWILENHLIRKALYKAIEANENITLEAPRSIDDFAVFDNRAEAYGENGQVFSAPLIIGADGKNSKTRAWMDIPVRGWSYHQKATVCTIEHENPHNNIAIEHFNPEGPFAVLPMTNGTDGAYRSSVVWSDHSQSATSVTKWDDETFHIGLNARVPDFYGKVKAITPRMSFPLGLKHAYRYVGPRMALVAEAAHAMHPIAGQGLNMGFRDIAVICDLIVEANKKGEDIGSDALLDAYQTKRRADNTGMMAATDMLNKLFGIKAPPVAFARKMGIKAVSRFRPAKQFFMKQAMGAVGVLPNLIEK
ncbi:MAG: UbiH/UbiF/VisC/COQ6 family ubiquinone biosynthesis hydroxylase [Bdellovibrionales bacterium]